MMTCWASSPAISAPHPTFSNTFRTQRAVFARALTETDSDRNLAGAGYVTVADQLYVPRESSEKSLLPGDAPSVDFDEWLASNITPADENNISLARKHLSATFNSEKRTIKGLRLASGLSQAALAKILETDQSYVSRIETGKEKNPTRDRIVALASALGVDANTIIEAIDA